MAGELRSPGKSCHKERAEGRGKGAWASQRHVKNVCEFFRMFYINTEASLQNGNVSKNIVQREIIAIKNIK